ncbi:hypothetical protein EPUS_07324 [Endocarpon pusillum Z07020]|uniref:SGNH hydrolase-type esterase domain-containing protein n=1 Tax=Endocarpon pusillum (strain Z07020 / HMAS-L-300199) TaxID=1263415 RepID=U1I353_ENDPU|nr:uncharacterized protein EPUS_07324 [Endocarpon pusillum Z07020]ERF76444.1 hypothetical protein EPUS_07324 [Endocarpon pusillum Z07020]
MGSIISYDSKRPLLVCALPRASPAPATGTEDATLVASISSIVKSAGLKPYATPLSTDEIKEWNALGDSFTAGIGSNGLDDSLRISQDCSRYDKAYPMQMNADTRWPGKPADRKLNFGACSGNVMQDIRTKQLSDNAPVDYQNFGKPQLAVITLGGNDLGFESAINACIIRAHGWPNIPGRNRVLIGIENKIQDLGFLGAFDELLLAIVVKGRVNGGADPPESFQLFVNGDLNFQIKQSAFRLANEGVVYVEGFQDSYIDHQFCDPKADTNLKKPISPKTWFWASDSREAFEAALDSLKTSSDPSVAAIPEQWRRIFHPKGTAYRHHSDVNLNTVLANRQAKPAAPPPPTPPPAPTPTEEEENNICGVWYRIILNHFEIRGENFDPVKFGKDGSGLKKEIKGCGALTKWRFEYTPKDPNFAWFASGQLPIGTKACVGMAVVSADGEGPDGCTGPG